MEVIRCWEKKLFCSELNDTSLNCTEIPKKIYELYGAGALAGYLVTELYQKI
jgi:hypothetical protein